MAMSLSQMLGSPALGAASGAAGPWGGHGLLMVGTTHGLLEVEMLDQVGSSWILGIPNQQEIANHCEFHCESAIYHVLLNH